MIKQPILMPVIGKESGDRWRLVGTYINGEIALEDWEYFFRYKNRSFKMVVCQGTVHDGASVPRWLQPILRMGGREMPDEAWLVHDEFYRYKGMNSLLFVERGGEWKVNRMPIPRKMADEVFRNELASERHGLSKFKAPLAYVGLRMAFWKEWNSGKIR